MLRFQVATVERALKQEKKTYKKLLDGTERRKESYKPTYTSREELDQAYIVGAVADEDYMRERSAIWNVYSDRGHIANIQWLEETLAKYQYALDNLEAYLTNKRKETIRACEHRRIARKTYNSHRRVMYRKKKREEKEARWRKYGLK